MTDDDLEPERFHVVDEFVAGLRRLKRRSGLSYRQLERRAETAGDILPRSTIAQALKGPGLPRREVVEAFVRACAGPGTAARWLAAYDRLERATTPVEDAPPGPPRTAGAAPRIGWHRQAGQPGAPETVDEFVAGLRRLKRRSGLSYRQLERRAETAGDILPRSTIAQALKGPGLPRRELVEAFVRACVGSEHAVAEAARLLADHDRLSGDESLFLNRLVPDGAVPPGGTPVRVPGRTRPILVTMPATLPATPAVRPARNLRAAFPLVVLALLTLGPSAGPMHPTAKPAVRPSAPLAWWRFEDPEPGGSPPLRIRGGAVRTPVPGGHALQLDGTGHAAARVPALRTDLGFSITAWVRLDTTEAWGTVVSLHAGDYDAVLLDHDPDKARWAVIVPDRATGWAMGDETVYSGVRPVAGAWTHLAAVYDPPARQLRLYVNGHLEATRPRTGMVRASGALDIGRALERGKPLDQWHGAVDDVRLYDRPLTGHEVSEVIAART